MMFVMFDGAVVVVMVMVMVMTDGWTLRGR